MFLRRLNLDVAADRDIASGLFLSNPDFELENYGRLPTAESTDPLWGRFPAGCAPEHRLTFVAFDHEQPLALAQVALHVPTSDCAALLLLVVSKTVQHQHIGCEVVERLSKQARRWAGIGHWRLSVSESNAGALAFWRHCGFRSLNTGRAVEGFAHRLITLQRPIKTRPVCQHHGVPEDAAGITARHLFARLG